MEGTPWVGQWLLFVTCSCVCKGACWQPARGVLWQVGRAKPETIFLLSSFCSLLSPTPFLPDLLFFYSSPFRSHLFPYQFYLVCRCHYAGICCVKTSIRLTCTECMYWGWAQPDALKGMVRAWLRRAHTCYVLVSSRDAKGQQISLTTWIWEVVEDFFKAWLCKFCITFY